MVKGDLIKYVAKRAGLTNEKASEAVEAVLTGVRHGVSSDGETKILGFGTFKNTVRKAREGRNPATGAVINIPEKNVVKFKPYF
jgi:DNA-binding protein HU-beta